MSRSPEVSVVMSVYNGSSVVSKSIESVLEQIGIEIEFIIVNDGSTDNTLSILNRYASKDDRIHIINQANQGLTKSLITGCGAAKGTFIARQDAGDVFLPEKLISQVKYLRQNPGVSMLSCGTRYIGPKGEFLYDVVQTIDEADNGLRALEFKKLRGPPHHCSVMFRKRDYDEVEGYRPHFYVAQDMDLWLRLVDIGSHHSLPFVLFEATYVPGSISGSLRQSQQMIGKLLFECAVRRRKGLSDSDLLMTASKIRKKRSTYPCYETANAHYFIGRMLYFNQNNNFKHYYWKAYTSCPLHIKSAIRFMITKNHIF